MVLLLPGKENRPFSFGGFVMSLPQEEREQAIARAKARVERDLALQQERPLYKHWHRSSPINRLLRTIGILK